MKISTDTLPLTGNLKADELAAKLAINMTQQARHRRQLSRLQDEHLRLCRELVPFIPKGEGLDLLAWSSQGEPVHLNLFHSKHYGAEDGIDCQCTVLDTVGSVAWTNPEPEAEAPVPQDPKIAAAHSAADRLRTPSDCSLRP